MLILSPAHLITSPLTPHPGDEAADGGALQGEGGAGAGAAEGGRPRAGSSGGRGSSAPSTRGSWRSTWGGVGWRWGGRGRKSKQLPVGKERGHNKLCLLLLKPCSCVTTAHQYCYANSIVAIVNKCAQNMWNGATQFSDTCHNTALHSLFSESRLGSDGCQRSRSVGFFNSSGPLNLLMGDFHNCCPHVF